jgi:hypothetical protein
MSRWQQNVRAQVAAAKAAPPAMTDRYLTDPMRRYLAALWLRQHGVCVSMAEWSAPRWAGMRRGLITRGLVQRAIAANSAYYMLTSSGEQILGLTPDEALKLATKHAHSPKRNDGAT